jgi:methyl-accepting chemotaxis protein
MAKKLPARSKAKAPSKAQSKSVAKRGTVARKITVDADLLTELQGQIAAINKSLAVIEFDINGNILSANDNFLRAMGYRLEEVVGQHHSMFVDAATRNSEDYRRFWQKLGRGEFDRGQYKRITKDGREVWIEASYNPILDSSGKPFKVVKYATDITQQVLTSAENRGQLQAVNRSQGVIEFDLNGNILNANENFLNVVGYRLEEIKGQHHGMFVDRDTRSSDEYRQFWEKLRRGEFDSGQYRRLGKGGREVWIQASYNPIFDTDGKPYKVVKYATDITQQVNLTQQMQTAVSRTQDVIKAAISGDLTRRIDTTDSSGDVLKMSDAINSLLSTVSEMFSDVQVVIQGATEGDLAGRVDAGSKTGDLRKMSEAVNTLLESVSEIVTSVKGAAGEVLRGAEEISQGNLNLSQRTEQQSSSLEETASSMEEMTSTVKQNADNAGQANQLATAARDQAEKGGAVVGKAVTAMAKINDASKKISDIIGVIDEIAFQTNLLALNAAVEAARAGEQGRGFAVVATEVRSLAGRSATAAKEIKELIQDSVKKVEDGSTLVTQSGATLDQIVTSVKKVSDIIAEIAAASREQSAGIEQVNQAVMQMDEMTQQNAALVEEATAASQSMAEQARALTNLMQKYNGGDSFEASVPVVQPRAAEQAAERRNGARPWAAKTTPPARHRAPAATKQGNAAPAAQPMKAAANGTDADWMEF